MLNRYHIGIYFLVFPSLIASCIGVSCPSAAGYPWPVLQTGYEIKGTATSACSRLPVAGPPDRCSDICAWLDVSHVWQRGPEYPPRCLSPLDHEIRHDHLPGGTASVPLPLRIWNSSITRHHVHHETQGSLGLQENKKHADEKCQTLFGLCRDSKVSLYPLIHLLRGSSIFYFSLILSFYFSVIDVSYPLF